LGMDWSLHALVAYFIDSPFPVCKGVFFPRQRWHHSLRGRKRLGVHFCVTAYAALWALHNKGLCFLTTSAVSL
jgi:hypothetical protein